LGGVCAPIDVKCRLAVIESFGDQGRTTEVIRRTNDLSGMPTVLVHDLGRVVDVLDGVLSVAFLDDDIGGNALRFSQLGHHVSFNEVIVRSASGHDDVWRYTGSILANAFEDTHALLR